ncbi:MAG: hypothetical protein PVJ92_01455 [Candidatus Dependentiae bacterium]|jgi:hypothetical protein
MTQSTTKDYRSRLFGFIFLLLMTAGCSFKGYHNPTVVLLPPHEGQEVTIDDVSVRVKPLRDFECAHYFDNRMVSKGVQPIQVYIQNNTNTFYVLDGENVSLPLLGRRRVGAVLYKNILARSMVWFIGVMVLWQVFVPVFVADAAFSMQANKNIKNDIESIAMRPKDKVVIAPGARVHKIFFVEPHEYHHHMTITLTKEQEEGEVLFRF